MAKAIMFQGTGSDVGKTVLVAGLCRLAANRGIKVAPFKPQNMSNNAAIADDGGEIGRGQWLQALAARVSPSIHMNPILLKPQSETGSQIVVHGKVWGQAKAREYKSVKPKLLTCVLESFEKLSQEYELILVEGAGSPAEINLRDGDIANMGFATEANVPVILIGDIDRGGVIASIVGTYQILPDKDRDMITGYLINKFRGDVSLFDDGLTSIHKFTGWLSYGVIPWLKAAAKLPAEDSVVLDRMSANTSGKFKIAIPRLPRMANFDDFDPLIAEQNIDVQFISSGEAIPGDANIIILPGTKSTIADLTYLRSEGWDVQLREHLKKGGSVFGICGGFQMLGRKIFDPDRIEGDISEIDGFGLLDIETIMEPEKVTQKTDARSEFFGQDINGYEIHIGRTTGPDCLRPFSFVGERGEGAITQDGLIFGTYLHGLFTEDDFRHAFLNHFGIMQSELNYTEMVDVALDDIANELEQLVDFDALLKIAETSS
ncbi:MULTISPECIES: cobyric acid synthase [unclassified Lentilitoribacter]|uniref:cobyric acid synthase n=1 Tax=unclassified Lentilitoribacter TaxID=2647570 RepID=UPI0013A6DB44|nr:cobyric acid synthase [Lentilitoribacter sp. Alg239-R112]